MFGIGKAAVIEARLKMLERKMLEWSKDPSTNPIDRASAITWKSAAEMVHAARTGKRWTDD